MAGIYVTVQESRVTVIFGKCRGMEGKLVPDENGGVLSLEKGNNGTYFKLTLPYNAGSAGDMPHHTILTSRD